MIVEDFAKHSIRNAEALKEATQCGCYFCLRVYPPSEVTEIISSPDYRQIHRSIGWIRTSPFKASSSDTFN